MQVEDKRKWGVGGLKNRPTDRCALKCRPQPGLGSFTPHCKLGGQCRFSFVSCTYDHLTVETGGCRHVWGWREFGIGDHPWNTSPSMLVANSPALLLIGRLVAEELGVVTHSPQRNDVNELWRTHPGGCESGTGNIAQGSRLFSRVAAVAAVYSLTDTERDSGVKQRETNPGPRNDRHRCVVRVKGGKQSCCRGGDGRQSP